MDEYKQIIVNHLQRYYQELHWIQRQIQTGNQDVLDLRNKELITQAKIYALHMIQDEHWTSVGARENAQSTPARVEPAWNDVEIPFAGMQGDKYVEMIYSGKELAGTGIGYWIRDETYGPTHVQSGYAFGLCFDDEETCQQYIQELAKFPVDWNCSRDELYASLKDKLDIRNSLKALNKKYEIEDAAATAGGGAW